MKKDADFHFLGEKDLKQKLQKEANEKGISDAECYRQKLKKDSQLTEIQIRLIRIENLLEKLTKRGADFGKRSSKIRHC